MLVYLFVSNMFSGPPENESDRCLSKHR